MFSSSMFGLLSFFGMVASALFLQGVYALCIVEWIDGREIILIMFSLFMAGLSAWGAATALENATFEYNTRNY